MRASQMKQPTVTVPCFLTFQDHLFQSCSVCLDHQLSCCNGYHVYNFNCNKSKRPPNQNDMHHAPYPVPPGVPFVKPVFATPVAYRVGRVYSSPYMLLKICQHKTPTSLPVNNHNNNV